MQPRFYSSEPAYRAPTTAWQREREGRVRPATLPVSRWEARALYAVVALAAAVVAVVGIWS